MNSISTGAHGARSVLPPWFEPPRSGRVARRQFGGGAKG